MENYRSNIQDLIHKTNSNLDKGLSMHAVVKKQQEYGYNQLDSKKQPSWFELFLNQFKDFLVIILLIAAAISIILGIIGDGGLLDGIIILAIVILNAFLGVNQEQKASNALLALKKMSSPHAKVLRDGHIFEVETRDLVVGDIVLLEMGDLIPADVRLISSVNLQIDESALTGESVPIEKDATAIFTSPTPLAERINSAYMSTLVTYGRAKAIVTEIGMNTEIGKIATLLDEVEEGKTPLQLKVDEFAKVLGIICIGVSVVVFILGLIQGKPIFDIFLTAVALAVAAIPEGLTAIITVVLALGMQRMVKRHAIIKNLATVETLGQATVICSDKTGTLTQNKMTVQHIYTLNNEYSVSGTGYGLVGDITPLKNTNKEDKNLDYILKISLLCNTSFYESEDKVIGDPTEGSLLVLAAKGGYSFYNKNETYPQLNEYPFDSTRKLMTSINQIDGKNYVLTKGAVDKLLDKCPFISIDNEVRVLKQEDKERILAQNEIYSKQAYRVLAFAIQFTDNPKSKDLENDLIFVGLVAMIDPPREEASDAIKSCHNAGIRVIMITGDHLTTAKAIGKKLNIYKDDDLAYSSEDLEKMNDEEYEQAILNCNIFARSTPSDKIRIVTILQKHGEIVAMTGDGVNDSPALKKANIGVAMGISGTEVSKEASNMILTDDNFSSIVAAVEEGRVIYSNIKKFTLYLISCNVGEIMIIFIAMIFARFFQYHIPLLAIHLLWINLVTDAFPAFALGLEQKEEGIMDSKPRDPNEKILDKQTITKVLIQGAGLMLAALISFKIGLIYQNGTLTQARTMIFVTVVFGELLRTYSSRFETTPMFKNNIFSNRYLNIAVIVSMVLVLLLVYINPLANIFGLEKLDSIELVIAISLSFIPVLFAESVKLWFLLHNKKKQL